MALNKNKVLLVDDSVFMLSTLKDMLRGTEFNVVGTAGSGAEALKKYKELKPDVVLLDIVLPDENGVRVLGKILDLDKGASIIIVSSLGTQEKVIECLTKGAKHFITKPFEHEGLLRVLRDFKHIGEAIPPKKAVELSFTGLSMGMKFFGQYVLEKGLINAAQLLKAVEYQKSVNLSIEEICLKKGLLNKEQIKRINDIQKNDLNREFGEIVLEKEFLTEEKLNEVLKEHKTKRIYIGESLVKINALTPEKLEEALSEYKEEQEKDEWAIGAKLEDIKNKLAVKTFINFTMKMFQKSMNEIVKLKACLSSVDKFLLRDYTITQKAAGDFNATFIVNVDEDVALKIASNLFSRQVEEIKEIEIDALKEFLNIINGNCCAKLSNIGINIETTPPEFYNNKTKNKYIMPKETNAAFASLISTIGDFDLVITDEK